MVFLCLGKLNDSPILFTKPNQLNCALNALMSKLVSKIFFTFCYMTDIMLTILS